MQKFSIHALSEFLTKQDLLNLTSINKKFNKERYLFFKKYWIDFRFNPNKKILKKIKKIKNVVRLDCLKYMSSLTHLMSDIQFFQPNIELPTSLTHLSFDCASFYNQPITQRVLLPNSLTHLTFGYCYNMPILMLPPNLKHLTFGYCFNQPINMLPNSLTHLTFGHRFNQPITKLPLNLTHLTLGNWFNQPINQLPNSLTHLTFLSKIFHLNKFCQNNTILPKNLKYLKIRKDQKHLFINIHELKNIKIEFY